MTYDFTAKLNDPDGVQMSLNGKPATLASALSLFLRESPEGPPVKFVEWLIELKTTGGTVEIDRQDAEMVKAFLNGKCGLTAWVRGQLVIAMTEQEKTFRESKKQTEPKA